MIQLQIQSTDLAQEFGLTQNDVDDMVEYVVEDVAHSFARQWQTEAKSSLFSSRNIYVNAIQAAKRGRDTSVVYLNPAAWLPNALELGTTEFDMKHGFLASDKVKYDKNGNPFLTIPFRFATSNAIGENEAFAGVMPREIHRTVKKLDGKPLNIKDIPSKYHIPQSASLRRKMKSKGFEQLSKKVETTSIYEGMKKTSGGYVTFRRVSLNSQKESFIHPGFYARNLAEKALSAMDIPFNVDVAIDNFLSNAGF